MNAGVERGVGRWVAALARTSCSPTDGGTGPSVSSRPRLRRPPSPGWWGPPATTPSAAHARSARSSSLASAPAEIASLDEHLLILRRSAGLRWIPRPRVPLLRRRHRPHGARPGAGGGRPRRPGGPPVRGTDRRLVDEAARWLLDSGGPRSAMSSRLRRSCSRTSALVAAEAMDGEMAAAAEPAAARLPLRHPRPRGAARRERPVTPVPALMVAYYFPPTSGAGTQRSSKFAKWPPAYGYRPVVVAGAPRASASAPHVDPSLARDLPDGTPSCGSSRAGPARWGTRQALLAARFRVEPGGVGGRGLRSGPARRPRARGGGGHGLGLALRRRRPRASPRARARGALGARSADPWALDRWRVYPTRLHARYDRARMRAALGSAGLVIANTRAARRAFVDLTGCQRTAS